jgi:hypothetical protein
VLAAKKLSRQGVNASPSRNLQVRQAIDFAELHVVATASERWQAPCSNDVVGEGRKCSPSVAVRFDASLLQRRV